MYELIKEIKDKLMSRERMALNCNGKLVVEKYNHTFHKIDRVEAICYNYKEPWEKPQWDAYCVIEGNKAFELSIPLEQVTKESLIEIKKLLKNN